MQWLNRGIVSLMPFMPKKLIWLFSRRYIAGTLLQHGIETSKALNSAGCQVTLDLLGEEVTGLEAAKESMRECLRILDAIEETGIDGSLSLKLTSLGLKRDKPSCTRMVSEIVEYGASKGLFVRIDMEDSTCTDDTLDIYRLLRKKYENAGTVIQAYMRRSEADVRALISEGIANLRLCKGIYDERETLAFKSRQEIRDNFRKLITMMAEAGEFNAVATHDRPVIDHTLELINAQMMNTRNFEFQMLLGVTEHRRASLVDQGHKMRIYVPYGKEWYKYSLRRLKENPQVAGHIIKNLFIRG